MTEQPMDPPINAPCPTCGGPLRLEMRLRATNALLGGTQLKVAAQDWPYLVCDGCGFAEAGKRNA